MIAHRGKQWSEQGFAICMAWDAFRIALGGKPEHFSLREIIAWLTVRHRTALKTGNTTTGNSKDVT